MLFTWFMLGGFILLFAPQKLTNKFQLAFARVFRRPLNVGRNVSLSARIQQPRTDVVSRREYNQLQNHIANLTEWLEQEHKKVEKLSGLRHRAIWKGSKFVLADVITASIDGPHSELIINRGEDDGLAKNQFVLGDNSIIGTISVLSSRTSQVKLITDSASKIAVKIPRLNINSIMQGSSGNSAKITLIPTKLNIKIGDLVCACKVPGFLDSPVIIGTVARYKRDDEKPLLWDITVKLACDIEKLDDVAVIVMNP